jgi:hypothetical protein
VRAEELNVRVGVLEKEGDDEAPGLPPALQLEQLVLEMTLFIGREAVGRCGVVRFPN